jgi:hypothetical protein
MVDRGPARRKKWSRTRTIVTLVVVFVLGWGVVVGIRWAMNPWSMSLPGRATLTGYWQGEVAYAPGDNRRIVLDLTSVGRRRISIGGNAKVCGAQNVSYQIHGDTHNYGGSLFKLNPRWPDNDPGVYLSNLEGEWGGDLLRFRGELVTVNSDRSIVTTGTISADGTVTTSEWPEVRFEMRRSNSEEYDSAC